MIGTLMGMCIVGMFLVGVLIPFGMLIYGVVVAIKDQIEISQRSLFTVTTSETFSTLGR